MNNSTGNDLTLKQIGQEVGTENPPNLDGRAGLFLSEYSQLSAEPKFMQLKKYLGAHYIVSVLYYE